MGTRNESLKRRLKGNNNEDSSNRAKKSFYDDPQPSTSKGAPTRNPHGFRVFNRSTSSSGSSSIKEFFSRQIVKSNNMSDNEKYCIICQVPFDILPSYQSKETHVTICMETDYSVIPPCSDSLSCVSRQRVHYIKYSHMQLAEFRSFQEKGCFTNESESSSAASSEKIGKSKLNDIHLEESFGSEVSNLNDAVKNPDISSKSNQVGEDKKRKDGSSDEEASEDLFFDASENFMESAEEHQPEKSTVGNNLKQKVDNPSMELTCLDFDKKTSSESLTSSFGDLENAAFKTKAVERENGEMKVEIRLNPKTSIDKLCIKIPQSEEKKQKTINVIAHRSQATITSYFNMTASSALKQKEKHPEVKSPLKSGFEAQKGSSARLKQCPFYKKIPNSSYAVDAFDYGPVDGITKYFLSHFHYDHYRGLSKNWKNFPIYCSPTTSRLIQSKLRVDPKWIRELNLSETHVIDKSVEVRLLDANHCPGAVMFLFRFLITGQVILHCGDFRASPEMEEYPSFWNWRVSKVFLDTTYCQPEYDFPRQSDVIDKTIEVVNHHLKAYPKTLVCVGSYTIGKERIFMAIAESLDCKIYASNEKAKTLRLLKDPVIEKRLTSIASSARIHVIEMGKCRNPSHLLNILQMFSSSLYNKVLSIIPTGWNHTKGGMSSGIENLKVRPLGADCFVFEVPYSEHSSFSELKRFIQFLKLSSEHDIVPTVNVGNPDYRNQMKNLLKLWVMESK